MSKFLVGTLAALLAGFVNLASPAQAVIEYPWCVQYGGGHQGFNATSCGFVSYAQCMQTASGMRAMCVENPAYPGPSERLRKSHHRKQSE
jgi:hypothetical protein